MEKRPIAVIDFGSQYTQLIARKLRELGFFAELLPYNIDLDVLKAKKPLGIVLSGGPRSVTEEGAPKRDVKELAELAPLLGICYGMQLVCQQYAGLVEKSDSREYGSQTVHWLDDAGKLTETQKVWMSHGDVVKVPPPGFQVWAKSEDDHLAALKSDRIWTLQFHPEVFHTENGDEILRKFAGEFCSAPADWKPREMVEQLKSDALEKVGDTAHIVCGLSGGVDSTVVAVLLTQVFGKERVHCVFVNSGLLRKGEYEQVLADCEKLGLNIKGVDASALFLSELAGISDPETKRKTIGRVFIEVFEKETQSLPGVEFLAQGTLYPDVIESVSPRGESVTIKSHHNVGGLPEKMNLKLVEPLRELFKDEVRRVGKQLDIPQAFLGRHPFPGPGLAIRIMGAVDKASLDVLRESDAIYTEGLREEGLYDEIWQAFCVLLPVKTVGVQGDGRTYEKVVAIRAVTSVDGMTADWFDFPPAFLRKISNRITNRVQGVNRVVYDVTSKPPGTIEWE